MGLIRENEVLEKIFGQNFGILNYMAACIQPKLRQGTFACKVCLRCRAVLEIINVKTEVLNYESNCEDPYTNINCASNHVI